MSKIYVLDTETTGISSKDQVIELGYLEVENLEQEKDYLNNEELNFIDYHAGLSQSTVVKKYLPDVPIHSKAYEVHGIGLTQLAGSPRSKTISIPEDIKYIIGHNILFDKRMIGYTNPDLLSKLDNIKYICTLALAKAIAKFAGVEYENHQLDTLTGHYYPDYLDNLISEKHNARDDVIKTLLVALKLVEHLPAIATWDDLYNFQEAMKLTKGKKK